MNNEPIRRRVWYGKTGTKADSCRVEDGSNTANTSFTLLFRSQTMERNRFSLIVTTTDFNKNHRYGRTTTSTGALGNHTPKGDFIVAEKSNCLARRFLKNGQNFTENIIANADRIVACGTQWAGKPAPERWGEAEVFNPFTALSIRN